MFINEVGSTAFEHNEVAYKIDYFLSDKEVLGAWHSGGSLMACRLDHE